MSTSKASPSAILAVIGFGVFVAADDLTVVSTMLRQIIFDLEIPLPAGLDQAAWIVNAYLIGYVVVMPFVGRLSDILGRRAVYVGALILFLAGSIWVPLAENLDSFIFGRVITALGGGAMVPVAMAVIGDIYQPQRRAAALGTLGAIDTAGWIWGPFYGALLVNYLNWRWQFYLNIPLSLAGILLAWWALADLPQPQVRQRIDWPGALLLSLALLALNFALLGSGDLQSAGDLSALERPPGSNLALLYILAAIALLAFVLWQRYLLKRADGSATGSRASAETGTWSKWTPPPLIDLALFRQVNFSPAILVNFLVGCVLIIVMVNVPLLINVLEIDPESAALSSGYLLSGMTSAMAVMAYTGGRLTSKFRYRPVTWAGLGFCFIGFVWMGYGWTDQTPYAQMAWQLVLLGIGFGLVIAPIGTAVINAAPVTQRGIASSLVIVFRLMGMSVGLSGLTSWGLHRFGLLRRQITLPDLPLSDPAYQQALVDGLTQLTAQVLAETFLISAAVVIVALLTTFRLRPDPTV